MIRLRLIGLALTLAVSVARPALADDPIKDIDEAVPALKDGARIGVADVQQAILDACKRRKFDAKVDSEGAITARWTHGSHWFDIAIAYTDSNYSIRYKDSARMDYNAAKRRIDDSYNEYVAGLNEHIEADLERALKRLKVAQKEARKVADNRN